MSEPLVSADDPLPVVDTTAATFARDVLERSAESLVLLDFWAPWCGPCRQLSPILETIARESGGSTILAKVNVDKERALASQFGVQSVPTVYAFSNGQPIDGFTGGLPESEVRKFVARMLGAAGLEDGSAHWDQAQARQAAGDFEGAAALYGTIAARNPDNTEARLRGVECLIRLDRFREAQEQMEAVDVPAVKVELRDLYHSLKAILALSEDLENIADPRAADDYDPETVESLHLFRIGERERALIKLLTALSEGDASRHEKTKAVLFRIFDAMGPADPAVIDARRTLSSRLFR